MKTITTPKKRYTNLLYDNIRSDFEKMTSQEVDGIRKYITSFILNALSKKYLKAPRTIENIVYYRV